MYWFVIIFNLNRICINGLLLEKFFSDCVFKLVGIVFLGFLLILLIVLRLFMLFFLVKFERKKVFG